jgi:beta-N-acetylhexosaminidase
MSMLASFITGCAGELLSADEWRFMQDARPAGLILFDRNCASPEQVRALVNQFKDAVGRDDLLIAIDQEGGRVQRLKPPVWRQLPSAASLGALYRRDHAKGFEAVAAISQLTALELARLDINMNCVPVLDLTMASTHAVIGTRSFGGDPAVVVSLGRGVAEAHLSGGVIPVMKHIPGHGRATRDSHQDLPVVDASRAELAASDFAPFRALAGYPAAMTAHVVFTAIDPDQPASTSPIVISDVIRGEIGFDGLLLSDDIGMGALHGSAGKRAEAVLAAGCDLALHCNGNLAEMIEVANLAPELAGVSLHRYEAAFARRRVVAAFDVSDALKALESALSIST